MVVGRAVGGPGTRIEEQIPKRCCRLSFRFMFIILLFSMVLLFSTFSTFVVVATDFDFSHVTGM